MVRADPSLLGESKQPSAKCEKSSAMCHCFLYHLLIGSFFFYFSRFFCQCVIWEIEYGRDWDFGGLLRDCSQANPTDCIRFEQQLFYPNPCRGLPRLLPQPSPFIFSFPFIGRTPNCEQTWSLRRSVFSCGLRTYNLMKALERNGPEQTGQRNIRPATKASAK